MKQPVPLLVLAGLVLFGLVIANMWFGSRPAVPAKSSPGTATLSTTSTGTIVAAPTYDGFGAKAPIHATQLTPGSTETPPGGNTPLPPGATPTP